MDKPTVVSYKQTLVKKKGGKIVWEFNHGEFSTLDAARTVMKPGVRYPELGWAANGKVTMLFCCTKGDAKIFLENGERLEIKENGVFLVPPKCWYFLVAGKKGFEAWMPSSPAWSAEQSRNKN